VIEGETMPKLTLKDLEKKREQARKTVFLREGGPHKAKITVHMGTCGIAAGARKVMSALLREIAERDIKDVLVSTSGCAGLCSREPMATIELVGEAPVKYVDLNGRKMKKIFEEHVLGGDIVLEYALGYGSEKTSY
jgi:NADP-reducing hydrogenase subunit HndB